MNLDKFHMVSVQVPNIKGISKLTSWNKNNCTGVCYYDGFYTSYSEADVEENLTVVFGFENVEDAIAFKLKWL